MQADAVNKLDDVSFLPMPKIVRSATVWNTLKATVIKDLQMQVRYRAEFLGAIVGLAIRVLYFALLSNVISISASESLNRELSGPDVFVFFIGAVMLFVFNDAALGAPLGAVSRDLYNGTLEFLYTNPFSRYVYYVGTVLSVLIVSQIVFLPLFFVLVFISGAALGNMLMVLLVCLLLLLVLVPMGVMVALLGLLWRQVGSVVGILFFSFEFLSGAYLPISALPTGIQYVSYFLPFTWVYDLIRYYSFDGNWNTILPVAQEWGILIVFLIVFVSLSRYLLKKVEYMTKRQGLHLI